MKEPYDVMEGANVDGASDNDCVGCDDGQEGKKETKRKKERKKQRKKENNF
jgi:hypothetical protein